MTFDIWHATNTEYLDFPIFVSNLTLNLDFMVIFFTDITCPLSKTIACNKLDSNTLCSNEIIAIFVKMTLTFVEGQGKETSHNMLHIIS
jgi:hypothetical protein